jgi:predicted permease
MPSTFRFPTSTTALWRPLSLAAGQRLMTIYGRANVDAPHAEVRTRLGGLAAEHAHLPRNYLGPLPLTPVATSPVSDSTRQALPLLTGGVALVFLVLGANVVILLLSRLGQRQHEFATCAALGASKPRLLRQIVLEHTFIGIAGAAASLGVAWAGSTMLPTHLVGRSLNVVDLDARALTAAALIGTIAVIAAGLIPAYLGTRGDPAGALRRTNTTGHTSFSHVTTQSLLLTQIALAAALLIGSTVLVRSFVNLMTADRGLTVDGVLRVRISNADEAFPGRDATTMGIDRLREEVRVWPEITASAISREIPPLAYGSGGGEAHVENVDGYRVSPEFFSVYGITLLQGSLFRSNLDADEVIVGERLARQMWPGEDALGKTFRLPGTRARQVVGVTREISLPALEPAVDRPEFFLPMGSTSRTLYLNLRCAPSCPPPETIRGRVRRIHPALGASIVPSGELSFAQQLELPQAIAQVSGTFALLALVTAGCGLSCVLAFVARRRRREFGIRQMLGASPADVRALVLKQGLTVLVAGTSLGAVLGWIGARSLSAFLYGVVVLDPLTWAAPLMLLAAASLGAMWIPCRIASYVNPLMLLREE